MPSRVSNQQGPDVKQQVDLSTTHVVSYLEHPFADEPRFGRRAVALCRTAALSIPTVEGVIVASGGSLQEAISLLETRTQRRFLHPEAPLLLQLSPARPVHRDYRLVVSGIGSSPALAKKVRQQGLVERSYRHLVAASLRLLCSVVEEDLDVVFDKDSTLEDVRAHAASVFRERGHAEYALLVASDSLADERTLGERLFAHLTQHGPVLVQAGPDLMTDASQRMCVATSRDHDSGEAVATVQSLEHAQLGDLFALRERLTQDKLNPSAPLFELLRKLEGAFLAPISAVLEQRGEAWTVLDVEPLRTSPRATLRVAVEMTKEGLLSETDALMAVSPAVLEQLIHPNIAPRAKRRVLAKGLPASPGAASGVVVFSAEDALNIAAAGKRAILVRVDTTPEDIHGMTVANGVLTARGGLTSHAAVVARGLGKCCVVGCSEIRIDYQSRSFSTASETIKEGDTITLDGSTGEVMWGAVETRLPEMGEDFELLLKWADKHRRLGVRANVNSLADAEVALRFSVEGVGLCRTEQLLLAPNRLKAWRECLLATTSSDRRSALERLLPLHREDIKELLQKLAPRPVSMRLLDPPLSEFLPETEGELHDLAKQHGVTDRLLRQRRDALHEVNPMLGHRGCRLAVTYPELYEMQVRAMLLAANDLLDAGTKVELELMFPMISSARELSYVRALTDRVAAAVAAERKRQVAFRVGAMIEVPRAVWLSGEIAAEADFFSFGTNDLTQTVFGISRDDAGRFLGTYTETGLLASDPFATLDRQVVAPLIDQATKSGRAQNGKLMVGLCGEHGGDPASIEFCDQLSLDYVSCSPYRVPIAKLSAARARIESGKR